MMKSVTVVRTAIASIEASLLMHLPLIRGLNPAATGLHWKTMKRTFAVVKARTNIPTAQRRA